MLTTVRLTAVLLVSLLVLSACSPGAPRDVDRLVDLGTHRLHLRCTGQGSPTVVIDTGMGDDAAKWQSMQAQIAAFTRVCTYDRAGYGTSDPGPMPRHSQQAAIELQQLLDAGRVKGPYLLVGHSLGGLNAQVFASQAPDRIAGLILLDPPPLPFIAGAAFPELYRMAAQQPAELKQAAAAARQATDPAVRARADLYETLASESAMLISESAAQVAEIESFAHIPLTVIGSGRPNPAFGVSAEAYQQFWIEQNRALAAKSTRGEFVLAPESGHYLYVDAPDVVLDAIRRRVQESREKPGV